MKYVPTFIRDVGTSKHVNRCKMRLYDFNPPIIPSKQLLRLNACLLVVFQWFNLEELGHDIGGHLSEPIADRV